MKYISTGALLASTAVAAHDAYLWTIDAGGITLGNPNQVTSVSSFTAERILARRKGVSDAHVEVQDADVLADLNRFGGWQQPLLGLESTQQPAKVFISISGYDGTVSDFNTLPDMWVEQPESTLLDIFETKPATENICEYTIKVPTKKSVAIRYTYVDQVKACLPQRDIEYLPAMMAITAMVPTVDKVSGRGIASFHRTLLHLSATENLEATMLVFPTLAKLTKPKKQELKKRVETPLELPTVNPQPFIYKANTSTNLTLPRVIPQYFQSVGACDNTTNSCMGHGKCVKAHGNLFHCKCNATLVRTNEDGTTKTVQWGGNACQKKDVSTQFLLFAGFGIVFTAVVVGSIGLLYSMGSQELPSVIGAGVIGPRAQK